LLTKMPFSFKDHPTAWSYTLSLHDALPICGGLSIPTGMIFGPDGNLYVSNHDTNSVLRFNGATGAFIDVFASGNGLDGPQGLVLDRKSTRLNSSHLGTSYAVFCLKKQNK